VPPPGDLGHVQCQGPHPVEVGGGTAVAAVRLPDGRTLLASGGTDGTVRLWDPATGAPILTLVIGERVHSLAAVDGGLAVGLESGIVCSTSSGRGSRSHSYALPA